MERGIIIPEIGIEKSGDGVALNDDALSPQLVRYYTIYWDKMAIVRHPLFLPQYADSSDITKLKEVNIVQFNEHPLPIDAPCYDEIGNSRVVADHKIGVALEAKNIIEKDPGQWVVHHINTRFAFPDNLTQKLLTADFKLTKCLPVPAKDIPLDKILDFKLRRSDELTALRISLDDVYLEISVAGDISRSLVTNIDKLKLAIENLNKVAKEDWKERLLASRSVSIELNYDSIKRGVIAAGAAGAVFSSPVLGLVAGPAIALASSLKFERRLSSYFKPSIGNSIDLEYLSSLRSEGFNEKS